MTSTSIVLHPPLSLRSPFHYRRHISCHSGKTGTSTPMPVAASWFSKALGQRLNTAGVLWSLKVATKQPQLLIPHVSVADIRSIEWDVLEKAGFRGVVFDKDNTITAPYSLALWPLLESSFKKCCDAFPGKVAVLSNSAGLNEYDPDGSHARTIEESIQGVHVIRHETKKPAGSAEEIEEYFNCPASNIVMVGDRYFTDIVYGNRNGFLTIVTQPLSMIGEPFVVQQVEVTLVCKLSNGYLSNRFLLWI
ncbi:Phosphatidylglycerophosphatase [Zostera marina]|uniref:Phosphatidylglycerophosphatase n=1 Tax=Zostera marina TaxID=29655 RepID=A0A0K9P4W3_ZOSMR|nr:Phosphatidylglycerophosphatase [Zostera marina]